MQFFPDMSTFIKIGNFQITWYAIIILTGAFLAYYLTLRQVRKWGYKDEIFENFFLLLLTNWNSWGKNLSYCNLLSGNNMRQILFLYFIYGMGDLRFMAVLLQVRFLESFISVIIVLISYVWQMPSFLI